MERDCGALHVGDKVQEASVVEFLHKVTHAALQGLTKPVKRRWARPKHEHEPFPLSEANTPRQARPDFVLLPDAAFEHNSWASYVTKPDERWLNWTAIDIVGVCKTSKKELSKGQLQAVRFVEEMRKVQPWRQASALAMCYTGNGSDSPLISIIRVDQGGVEKDVLDLSTSVGVFDFVRLLVGLALTDDGLGELPNMVLRYDYPSSMDVGRPSSTFDLKSYLHVQRVDGKALQAQLRFCEAHYVVRKIVSISIEGFDTYEVESVPYNSLSANGRGTGHSKSDDLAQERRRRRGC